MTYRIPYENHIAKLSDCLIPTTQRIAFRFANFQRINAMIISRVEIFTNFYKSIKTLQPSQEAFHISTQHHLPFRLFPAILEDELIIVGN